MLGLVQDTPTGDIRGDPEPRGTPLRGPWGWLQRCKSSMLELEHEHPHDSLQEIPDRLPPAVIREYSQPQVAVALRAIALEWIAIAAACTETTKSRHPLVYLVAVAFIGARQHALT